jgi:NAD(P)-dependent dehydrogenase (short-subunit alcohol dehydrogenase family)
MPWQLPRSIASEQCTWSAITLAWAALPTRGSARSPRGSGYWESTCGGVIHGIRAFLPVPAAQSEGHIVNTASIAGLIPGTGPIYDAAKHAVVAISEDLYRAMNVPTLPIGVSVLCPGWVRTSILQADRNWPQGLGAVPRGRRQLR